MTLSLVVSSLANGGAERVASVLANGFFGAGHRVQVITYHPELADDYPLVPGIVRTSLDFETDGLSKILRLRRALEAFGPEAVLSFTNKLNVRTLAAGWGKPWKTLVTEHNVPSDHPLPLRWELARRWLYPRAAALVAVSPGVAAEFPYLDPSRLRAIPNPVAPHSHRRLPGTHRRIVAAGRLVPVKGFDLLLEAFGRANLPDWTLDFWGEGPERGRLEVLAQDLGLSDRAVFRGWTSEPLAQFPGYDFLVLSSRSEGFGNVLVEALSVGLPVVAFDCPTGPRTVVRDGRNGLLVPPADVGALAAALERMAQDGDLREALGRQALVDSETWGRDAVLAQWNEVLSGLPR